MGRHEKEEHTSQTTTGAGDEAKAVSAAPSFLANDAHFSTRAIHAGQSPEQWNSMAVVPPISLATTFKQDSPGVMRGYEYSRSGNPTRQSLETCLAALDGAKHSVAFSSGLGATNAVCSLLEQGDHIVAVDDIYGGTNRYFRKVLSRTGVDVTFSDLSKPGNIESALKENTKMVWFESPTNPTLKLVDIKNVAEAAHKFNKDIIVVVDNTFLSAYFQRPLELGADLVLYSVSKYMNGHSDVIMGSVSVNDDALAEKVKFLQYAVGSVPGPFDCYLVNRSLKTLKVRMEEHQRNAIAVAKYLESHPFVSKVICPSLESHPQHSLALRQQYGHSGVFSFYHKGGVEASRRLLSACKTFILAESLGGYESLIELPYLMTHTSIAEKERVAIGVTSNLVRVSVGLESHKDLIADLEQALKLAQEVEE